MIGSLGPAVIASTNVDGTVVVERGGARVYISKAQDVPQEYEPESLARIREHVAVPHFYTVDFADIDLCKQVLLAVADDAALAVDNDHGLILSGRRFAARIRESPDWDWRRR